AYFHDPSGDRTLIAMTIDADTGVLVRRDESGGFLVHYADPTDQPTRDTSFDPRFLEALAERIGNRFPFLEAIPVDFDQCWAGLDSARRRSADRAGHVERRGDPGHHLVREPADILRLQGLAVRVDVDRCTERDRHLRSQWPPAVQARPRPPPLCAPHGDRHHG